MLNFPTSSTAGDRYQTGSSATYVYNGSFWTVDTPPTQIVLNATSASYATTATSASFTFTAVTASHSLTASYSPYEDRDILFLQPSATQNLATAGTTILFNTIKTSRGGLSYNAGVITGFKSGKLYECSCVIQLDSTSGTSYVDFSWYENNTTAIGAVGYALTVDRAVSRGGQPEAFHVGTATNLRVKTISAGTGATIGPTISYMLIKEI